MKNKIFITAIGTGSGKTLTSAIFTEALLADYWKPIQTGKDDRDLKTVASLISNQESIMHAERYWLDEPASPHAAAQLQNIKISLADFKLPKSKNDTIIIEGAGGVMVPINYEKDYVIDLANMFDCQVVLVSNYYLGSINHTLLTYEYLKYRNAKILGIVFNGKQNTASREAIIKHTNLKVLLEIDEHETITKQIVKQYADTLIKNLY
jgi:dethiobiotin synthetase